MRRSRTKSAIRHKPEWAIRIGELRQRLNLSQAAFGAKVRSSAMGISRWETGNQEPTASGYIELGTLAGAPFCWYFWGRAGLRAEDLMRVLPKRENRSGPINVIKFRSAHAGSGGRKLGKSHLVAIPLLKAAVASHGGRGDSSTQLHNAPVESMIAAPIDWCPNPNSTTCLRVTGDSMRPLIYNGYILAVDTSETSLPELNGKIVIAWNKDMGLTVSRLQHFERTEVLQPENREYKSVVMNSKNKWKIVGKVLWWVGSDN
jgi:phage repressor protein C with HTH and peptisase S24 domain